MAQGGPEEQVAELVSGNTDAKVWDEKALNIVEWTMEENWHKGQKVPMLQEQIQVSDSNGSDLCLKSLFDWLQQTLITHDGDKGWAPELSRYLKDIPAGCSIYLSSEVIHEVPGGTAQNVGP